MSNVYKIINYFKKVLEFKHLLFSLLRLLQDF